MEKYTADCLQRDEFFLFYEMMVQSLKTDNVKEGLSQSLFLLKLATKSESVFLHKKGEDGKYVFYDCNTGIENTVDSAKVAPITCIVNKTGLLVETKKNLDLHLDFAESMKNVKMFYIKTRDHEYILTLKNMDEKERVSAEFYKRLDDTMHIILKRMESYERNTLAVNMDLMTGLDNRNSYQKDMEKLRDEDKDAVYVLFDLFRLKYINDTFSHSVGDNYIQAAANILKRYWPKYFKTTSGDLEQTVETGHCVYRIGGDEFALVTTKEKKELTEIKAQLAAEELALFDLGLADSQITIGLNYGVVEHKAGDSMKTTYIAADDRMQEHKKAMYESHQLQDRRRR